MNDSFIFKMRFLLRSRSVPVTFLRRFSYKDIKHATDGFSRVIGTSSHGASYKARFQNGRVAVVKEIHLIDHQDDDSFYREVQLLGRLHHRHIVALDGFSVGRKRFLVFENVENGSLKEHLNDPLKTPLDWRIRLKIAVGVAAALEYLHFFCDPPVYHVSISSSTIMLDENYNAKLSDVGLLGSGSSDHVMARRTSNCNGQVYGNIMYELGLLILELITGQSSDKTGTDLSQWIEESCFPTSIYNMIDPDLGNNYDSRELKGLLAVARFCIKSADEPNSFTPQIYRYLQKKVSIHMT